MHLSEAAIRTLPQLGVAHGSQEVVNLLLLVLRICLDLQPINLLQNFSFFLQQKLQGEFLILLAQLGRSFDLLCLIEAPSVELITQDLEVTAFLWIDTNSESTEEAVSFVSQVEFGRLSLMNVISSENGEIFYQQGRGTCRF